MQTNEASLIILADFPRATSAWSSVVKAAQGAARLAATTKRDAQHHSDEAIAAAQGAVSRIVRASRSARLSAGGQKDLSRAQLALTESRVLHRQEQYAEAQQRAIWAAGVARQLHDDALTVAGRYVQKESIVRWHRWKTALITRSRREGPAILIEKADHRLTLYRNGKRARVYDVDLGPNWMAAKTYAGDTATPEGPYRVIAKKDRGETAYHRALLINYPTDRDRKAFATARRRGDIPARAGVGGLIEIHGSGGRGDDWTRGCVAMSNNDIDDLFRRVPVGTPVTIVGGNGQRVYERMRRDESDGSPGLYER
jgi:L,D-peptidoglycan transpeptidase YkuD (ErfK/YbiS/YcfS/YnhG family)